MNGTWNLDNIYTGFASPEYDRDYEKIFGILGCETMLGNETYTKCAKVNENRLNKEVVTVLDEAFKKFTRRQILDLFKANDLACEAAYEPLDIYEDEQVWTNRILTKIPYPSGEKNMPTNPVNFASVPEPSYVIGGSQGAHTVEIMEELGYSREEIKAALLEKSVEGEKKLQK